MQFILLGLILISDVGSRDPTLPIVQENMDTLNYISYQGSEVFPTTTNKVSYQGWEVFPTTSNKMEHPATAVIEDKWFSQDKLHHFSYSFGITGLTYHIYHCQFQNPAPEARTFSISLASVAGISKEFYDRYCKKGNFSYKDLVAGALGITLATLLLTIH